MNLYIERGEEKGDGEGGGEREIEATWIAALKATIQPYTLTGRLFFVPESVRFS